MYLKNTFWSWIAPVTILVFMELALQSQYRLIQSFRSYVTILVFMELALQ